MYKGATLKNIKSLYETGMIFLLSKKSDNF